MMHLLHYINATLPYFYRMVQFALYGYVTGPTKISHVSANYIKLYFC